MPDQRQLLQDEITEVETLTEEMDQLKTIFNSFEFMASVPDRAQSTEATEIFNYV